MERKKALVTAGAVSGTLLAASTAFAFTGGLLDLRADDGAGTLAPVTTLVGRAGTVPSTTAGAVPGVAEAAPAAPVVEAPTAPPVTRSEASGAFDDDDDDGDGDGDGRSTGEVEREDDHDEDEHEFEGAEHEYEGADDDD